MRVLAVTPLYPPHSLVGSWLSTHLCLAHLADRGHDVEVVRYLGTHRPYRLDGVSVLPKRLRHEAFARAELVVSHLGDNEMAARLAASHGIPLVRMVHSPQPRARLDGAALAVFNSHSLRDATGWDGPSIVVHPPVHPDRYRTTPGDQVTLVNLSSAKGGHLLWQLSRAMPDVEFLGVRGHYGRQIVHSAPNVEVVDPTTDMRTVYARTRILLAPSAAESWGRVGLEAATSGIPTIAHPTPGLQESLGPAGIFVNRSTTSAWVREIRRLSDPQQWAAASAAAQERSAQFDTEADLDRFASHLEELACPIGS